MILSNWFDAEFAHQLQEATAEQALELIARNPRLIQAVKDALAAHDSQPPMTRGPSRCQAVRVAIEAELNDPMKGML